MLQRKEEEPLDVPETKRAGNGDHSYGGDQNRINLENSIIGHI